MAEVLDVNRTNGSAKDGNAATERQGISLDKEAATAKRKSGRLVNNPEAIAIDTIITELEELTPSARARVAAYVWGWCQEQAGVNVMVKP